MVAVHASIWNEKRPVQPHKVETRAWLTKIRKRFVTFPLDSVNHSTAHKTRTVKKEKVDDKAPRILGPADKTDSLS